MGILYLFDTNILVHLIRDDATGQRLKGTYTPLMLAPTPLVSIVSHGEIRSLAYQWSWGKQRQEQMRFLLAHLGKVPVGEEKVLESYAAIDSYSESMGRSMGKNDIWIAAAAYKTGARLVTTDRDFDHLQPNFIEIDLIELSEQAG
jgi:predicted nucleic acid-binding protein